MQQISEIELKLAMVERQRNFALNTIAEQQVKIESLMAKIKELEEKKPEVHHETQGE